jgi:PhnB protein
MAKVSTYLNFNRNTEEAFTFYKSVFGGEFAGEVMRYGDNTAAQQSMSVPDEDKNLILHIGLSILDGHMLMGTDITESMGFEKVNIGNHIYITLEPDSKEETERLFTALSTGGKIISALHDSFWGSYYGVCTDQFGIQWIVDFPYASK